MNDLPLARIGLGLHHPKRMYHLMVMLYIMISFCTLYGCHSESPKGSKLKKCAIRLKWLFNASTLGELWAKERDIYKKYGLDVELKEGGAEANALTELELGRIEFGVASGDQVLRALAKGASPVLLLQIFQKNPLEWMYIQERTNIKSPLDLKGKTVGITFGGNDETIFRALMAKYGLTEKDVHLYAVHYDYGPFWKGEVELWPVYRNTQGVFLTHKIHMKEEHPGFFDPHLYGVSFVANCLVTSRSVVNMDPDMVKRMVQAEREAWREALRPENEDDAVTILKKYDPNTPTEILREQIRKTRQIVLLPQGDVGKIDKEAWLNTFQVMNRQDLLDGGHLDIHSLLAGM